MTAEEEISEEFGISLEDLERFRIFSKRAEEWAKWDQELIDEYVKGLHPGMGDFVE